MASKRKAHRLAIMRYERWLVRNHPTVCAPPCVLREYNRHAQRHNQKQRAGKR